MGRMVALKGGGATNYFCVCQTSKKIDAVTITLHQKSLTGKIIGASKIEPESTI